MPLRVEVTDNAKEFVIDQKMYRRRHTLTLSKDLCCGCGLCIEACPKEAVKLVPAVKKDKMGLVKKPLVTIDPAKCNFCGICDVLCPFGAVRVNTDGKHAIPVLEKESFPQLLREIRVDMDKCERGCIDCAVACPLQIITVCPMKPEVIVDKDLCPACGWCEVVCTEYHTDAIRVEPIFYGTIKINTEKCPGGCRDCVDGCPVDAIGVGEDGKVEVDERFCVYCKACINVCPEEGAIEAQRAYVAHTPVKSGAWNKALERVTSTGSMIKEIRGRALKRLMESVQKRTL